MMKSKRNPTCLFALLLCAVLCVTSIGCLAEPFPYVNIKRKLPGAHDGKTGVSVNRMKARLIVKTTMFCIMILCSCLFIQPPCAALEKGRYMSVIQLKEETKSGWHETYKAYGRTVAVDVDVKIPQFDALPVLRIKKTAAVSQELLQGYIGSVNEENYLSIGKIPSTYTTPKAKSVWFKESFLLQPEEILWEQRLTEDSPLTAQAALDIFRQELSLFLGKNASTNYCCGTYGLGGDSMSMTGKQRVLGSPSMNWGHIILHSLKVCMGFRLLWMGTEAFLHKLKGS